MKPRRLAERRLAGLRKALKRLRLGYARVLARRAKVQGDLPAKILKVKAKIAQISLEIERRGSAA